jgi:hypothetical protein
VEEDGAVLISLVRSKDHGLAGHLMKDFHYLYILVSQGNPAIHYTGIARDLEQRPLEHNRF